MVSLTISAFSITPTAYRPSIYLIGMEGFTDMVPPIGISQAINVLIGGATWQLAQILVSSTSIMISNITTNAGYAANVNIINHGITLCYKV